MGVTYFKRYRMEYDLTQPLFPVAQLSTPFHALAWNPDLLEAHAKVKYRSFCYEIDANVFPCLGDKSGCQRLMTEISSREAFIPEATWLIASSGERHEYCGTIQGLRDRHGFGAIQNLGVIPGRRGYGLGSQLLWLALNGFRDHQLKRAYLEVTSQNLGAVRLYERLGFRRVKTVYKAVEVAYA